MTWWSEYSAAPRFVLAKLAIRCRFVDRFVGPEPPPMCQANGSLLVTPPFPVPVPASPVPRLQRYYEGATTSRANPVPYGFGSGPHMPLRVRVRQGAPDELGGTSSGLEHLFSRRSVPGM